MATLVALLIALKLFEILENKKVNIFINIAIVILIASLINSTIYFGCVTIINGVYDNFISMLIGSYIGKTMCLILSLITYLIISKYNYKKLNNNI